LWKGLNSLTIPSKHEMHESGRQKTSYEIFTKEIICFDKKPAVSRA